MLESPKVVFFYVSINLTIINWKLWTKINQTSHKSIKLVLFSADLDGYASLRHYSLCSPVVHMDHASLSTSIHVLLIWINGKNGISCKPKNYCLSLIRTWTIHSHMELDLFNVIPPPPPNGSMCPVIGSSIKWECGLKQNQTRFAFASSL